jgi:hypothetical protein
LSFHRNWINGMRLGFFKNKICDVTFRTSFGLEFYLQHDIFKRPFKRISADFSR